MTQLRLKSEKIRSYILKYITAFPDAIAKKTAEHFNISRQAVNKHLTSLVNEQIVLASGETRNKTYKLAPIKKFTKSYDLSDLREDIVWSNDIEVLLGEMPKNVIDIWHYGFTEMLNNAIDHSLGKSVSIDLIKTAVATEIYISDDGIGIFKKIKDSLRLLDERQALLELSKGKLTTAPSHHSGEGIFFTSRMFDRYNIISGEVHFSHEFNHDEDWLLEASRLTKGTVIFMSLNNHSSRRMSKIFDKFTTGENYGFNKTVVPVKLVQYGNESLISRSQAKRLLARIDKFKTVIFDFKDVDSVGQAFADEIFRVFALQNPKIVLIPVNVNKSVEQMIERAKLNLESN